ncbi:nitronate monooxygenase family protein [Antrihabitans sp. YC2-6]|uniref:NAD(P)H-dependent flavin oxidoreductase n=1 Tax=Antrihabitans sp. YC2-6 TaxID=2799498 RepID=UPI0018F5BA14|nr:nitronate monooxygenase family protein [Antrihabitans sp. YC2-6]MBJ8345849.1 nitronate monooxygenase [Antrihabitans sp. YC2-6]
MRTDLCDKFGIEYPIFGFTPSEHVAAAITRAGGLGVLGCVRFNDPEELDAVLDWMDANTDGKPYGVDIVMPAKIPTEGTSIDLEAMIPPEHRAFVDRTLNDLGVPPLATGHEHAVGVLGWLHSVARSHVDVSLKHPIKLIANALGSPPKDVIDQAHAAGVPVAALAGAVSHARSHIDNGVDIVIAQGYEAGGHTGEIGSMVLWPEIVDAVGDDAVVLAAGGIGSGRQVAAALALGAQGVWMGSYWLTCAEYRLGTAKDSAGPSVVQRALLAASSADTVRTRIFSGKPARLLKTKWTEAWARPDAPQPLPMPLQNILVSEAHQRIALSSDPEVVAMPVGQIVGRMNDIRPVADVMADLLAEFDAAAARIAGAGGRG